MPYSELPSFLGELRKQKNDVAVQALEFTILTGARTGEVLGARWTEIKDGLWVVPAALMKKRKEHHVPLSDAAVALVERMRAIRSNDYVFGDERGKLNEVGMLAILRRLVQLDYTVHGFRSSFRDWAAENGISDRLAEFALAHGLKDTTEAAYNRTNLVEQRRSVMQAWADFCNGKSNVVPFARHA